MKKQTIKINTALTYKWIPAYGTTPKMESLTVPGEAYTIQQLLDRTQGGIPINSLVDVKEGHFASDADYDTFVPEPDFDIVDADLLHQQSTAVIKDAEQKLAASKSKKKTPVKPTQEAAEHTTEEKQGLTPITEEDALNGPKNASP